MVTSKVRVCRDCVPGTSRPAPRPGPRCVTHHREVIKDRRLAAKEKRVEETYGITPEQYDALYWAQDMQCYICQRATGTGRKRLSVDHDHACCNGPISCGRCVRGLLCSPCNKLLGHLRDQLDAAWRITDYLTNPPAKQVLQWKS